MVRKFRQSGSGILRRGPGEECAQLCRTREVVLEAAVSWFKLVIVSLNTYPVKTVPQDTW